jgi:hypothetical protein
MADPARPGRGDGEGGGGGEGGGDAGAGADGSVALRLQEASARFGASCWVERQLFGLIGTWAGAPGLPDEAQVFCFEASAQHAWHAELWEARLPVLAGVDRERLARPVGPTAESLLARLAPGPGVSGGDDVAAGRRFLVGLARVVLPLLLVSYRELGQHLTPVSDGPAIRALTLVLRDEEEELATVQAMIDATLITPELAQEASEWDRTLREAALPAQGGLHAGESQGLLPWSEADAAW